MELYLFPFLHQATTSLCLFVQLVCCISSLFYIKPHLSFLILTTRTRCISSLFYIKPQRQWKTGCRRRVVSLPFSTSSHNACFAFMGFNAVVSLPFSTSSHNQMLHNTSVVKVVSLPFSTSSHNWTYARFSTSIVVSLPFSTSSHNSHCLS